MRFYKLIFIVLLMSSCVSAQTYKQGDEVFINKLSENILLSPSGSVLAQLQQGTKLTVLAEDKGWVAVSLVGWIPKTSLVKTKESITGFSMQALHILVETEAEAKEIKSLLASGKDFKELAKEKSKGPNAKKGGDLGIIHKGDLLPELDSAIRKLKIGQISEIVKSELGYHIFKRLK